jgi:hypothetical protein
MRMLSFINLFLVFNAKKMVKYKYCEFNIDCPLPQVCCKGIFNNYCCIPEGLTLAPIPIKRK